MFIFPKGYTCWFHLWLFAFFPFHICLQVPLTFLFINLKLCHYNDTKRHNLLVSGIDVKTLCIIKMEIAFKSNYSTHRYCMQLMRQDQLFHIDVISNMLNVNWWIFILWGYWREKCEVKLFRKKCTYFNFEFILCTCWSCMNWMLCGIYKHFELVSDSSLIMVIKVTLIPTLLSCTWIYNFPLNHGKRLISISKKKGYWYNKLSYNVFVIISSLLFYFFKYVILKHAPVEIDVLLHNSKIVKGFLRKKLFPPISRKGSTKCDIMLISIVF